jgi:hypothetical protein
LPVALRARLGKAPAPAELRRAATVSLDQIAVREIDVLRRVLRRFVDAAEFNRIDLQPLGELVDR